MKVKVKSLSRVQPLATPWTAAHQAPPSMGFPGKSTGVGCHCLLPVTHYDHLNLPGQVKEDMPLLIYDTLPPNSTTKQDLHGHVLVLYLVVILYDQSCAILLVI